ncbi:hypothetical protein D3C80_2241480 [compost metagenome]
MFLRPLRIRPYFVVKVAVGGFVAEVSANQLFEISTFFAFGDRSAAVGIQQS